MPEIVLTHGNYQELESYQNSVIIFDATQDFCANFLKKGDRTIDQMIQAARSGKQNIIEGCMASGISSETEIKLIGVARASLEELVEDYRDFLRTHKLPLWKKEDPRILQIRQLARQKNKTYETYKSYFSAENPELFCNTMISLIHQTNYLLDRQIKSLEKSFTEKGGIRERMSRARKSYRTQQTEEVLSLLREVYRELAKQDNQELMQKIEKAANLLKDRGQIYMLTNDKILDNLCNAIRKFYDKDSVLIEYQVAERALTHKLAEYLQELFPDYNVDCEYNKVGNGDPKRIDLLMADQQDCPKDCNKCAANKCVVFPDIIVHKRGRDENILVIEAKTAWSGQAQVNDYKKLQALIDSGEYHYQLGVAFRFSGNFEETIKTFKLFFGEKSK